MPQQRGRFADLEKLHVFFFFFPKLKVIQPFNGMVDGNQCSIWQLKFFKNEI